jgi:hypothetical protein
MQSCRQEISDYEKTMRNFVDSPSPMRPKMPPLTAQEAPSTSQALPSVIAKRPLETTGAAFFTTGFGAGGAA